MEPLQPAIGLGMVRQRYDAAGKVTADGTGMGTHSYTREAEGRVRTVVTGGVTTTFTHYASGAMAQRSQTGRTMDYLYDPARAPVARYDATNRRWRQRYVRLGGRAECLGWTKCCRTTAYPQPLLFPRQKQGCRP